MASGEFEQTTETARAAGAIRHRFGIGDGFILVVDEWESAEHFERFFSNPDLQAFIGSVGAAPAPPEVTVTEAVSAPGQFRRADRAAGCFVGGMRHYVGRASG